MVHRRRRFAHPRRLGDARVLGAAAIGLTGSPSGGYAIESDGHGGWTVFADGQPQSHVDLDDPGLIAFEYVQHFTLAIASCSPAAPAPLRVTHVGGGGLTLARWVQHARPGSPQIVLEPHAALSAAVRERLPLPRGHRIRVRPVDGRTGVSQLGSGSADVVVLDAYAAGRVPAELVTPTFLTDAARVLGPGGLLLANLADEPGLRWATRVLATIAAVEGMADLAILATHDVLKGRRFGNLVAVASKVGPQPLATPAQADSASRRLASPTHAAHPPRLDVSALQRVAASAPIPTGVRLGSDLTRLIAGAKPFTDTDAVESPSPPDLGAWRVR